MRIALFAPYLPAPPSTGGRIRTHYLALAAKELGALHLFATAARRELASPDALQALELYESVAVAPARLRFLPALGSAERVRSGVARRVARAFETAHRTRPFDLVWVEHAHAARVALAAGVPWVLDEHNIESHYTRAKLEAAGRRDLLARREVRLIERWERSLWQAATRVACVTTADAETIARVRGSQPELIPNGVDLERVSPRWPSEREGMTVLFIGLMNHPPNERGAEFLAREVMPRLWQSLPEARLVLCGHNPSAEVKALAGRGVEVTGSVPSVLPYLQDSKVYANALWQGGGSSLKVLEALAAGIPLVSTAVGVRGFPLRAGEHFWAAENADDFARSILTCFEQTAEAERRARRGRELAQGYGFSELGERFKKLLTDAATQRA